MSQETEWTSITLRPQQKQRFDDVLPDGKTRGVFIMELLDHYENGGDADVDELAEAIAEELDAEVDLEELRKVVGSEAEQASYRGAKDAIESKVK